MFTKRITKHAKKFKTWVRHHAPWIIKLIVTEAVKEAVKKALQ